MHGMVSAFVTFVPFCGPPSNFRQFDLAMNDNQILRLCDQVRETAFAIHNYHRQGHLEKIYENALRHRLAKQGLKVRQQIPLQVFDEDGTLLGDMTADLLLTDELLIELKAVKTLLDEHTAQLLGYLRSSKLRHRLLINFGSAKFEIKEELRMVWETPNNPEAPRKSPNPRGESTRQRQRGPVGRGLGVMGP